MKTLILLLVLGTASTSLFAAEFDRSNLLTCSLGNLSECTATGCEHVTANSVNAPQFLKINLKKKTLQSIAAGKGRTSKLENIEVTDSEVLLSGSQPGNERIPQGFAYSINISIHSGNLSFAVASEEVAFTGFGACIVDN